ncbi:hypothetical protein MBCUT_06500 [Methanobrevibacter cuticularis]|uniref:Uncharacterized protein n=1 Tax=Methanobrevibacter cuticularis TaxID=47311 RepID=A0A166EG21_9EURY|nr:hypothetical protein [Methanobrevibacter cuticularis]KZX16612.1 hypothetical protein MBCUT_06500 [Methanobrevibacter cuticularis]
MIVEGVRIRYTIETDSFLEDIGKRTTYAFNPNLDLRDDEAISIFKEKIKSGEYKGNVKLIKKVKIPQEFFPLKTVLAEEVL